MSICVCLRVCDRWSKRGESKKERMRVRVRVTERVRLREGVSATTATNEQAQIMHRLVVEYRIG